MARGEFDERESEVDSVDGVFVIGVVALERSGVNDGEFGADVVNGAVDIVFFYKINKINKST